MSRDPPITDIVKVGGPGGYVDPDYRISYSQCSFCEQTSLDGKQDIDHHPDCPHHEPDLATGGARAAIVGALLDKEDHSAFIGELVDAVNREVDHVQYDLDTVATLADDMADHRLLDKEPGGTGPDLYRLREGMAE